MALTFYRGPEYLALPREPQPWLIRNLVPIGGLVNIYGKPKSLKSYLALNMGLAIAHNEPEWLGFEVTRHGPVAYLQIDTPREEWAGRAEELRTAGFSLDNFYFADMNTVPYPYNILDQAHMLALKQSLTEIKPVLVIVDTLRESFSGDENDSNTMRDVIANLVAASRPAAMILLSHQRKDGLAQKMGGEDLMDDNRGSSYVPGRMDVIIKMTGSRFTYKGRAVPQGTTEVEFIKPPGIFRLTGGTRARREVVDAVRQLAAELLPGERISQDEMARRVVRSGAVGDVKPDTVSRWPEFKQAFKQYVEGQSRGPSPTASLHLTR